MDGPKNTANNGGMDSTKYISITELARTTGLPLAWLKDEAKAGRIPRLLVGRRLLFDPEAVDRVLAERAGRGESHD